MRGRVVGGYGSARGCEEGDEDGGSEGGEEHLKQWVLSCVVCYRALW